MITFWGSRAVVSTILAVTFATSGFAQDKPTAKKAKDPNEVVCEKEEVLGSRLATRRVCHTRAEWLEQRRMYGDLVQRSQTNTCQRQAGC